MFVEINRAKPLLRSMLLFSLSHSLTLIDDLFEIRYLSVVGCLSLKATSTSSWFHLSVSTTSINWFTFNTPQHTHTFLNKSERENFLWQYQQQNFLILKKTRRKEMKRRRRKFEEGENPCKVLSCISLSIKMKMTTRWKKKNEKIDLCENSDTYYLLSTHPLNPPHILLS